MAKKIEIYQIDAFSERACEGNPAGVTFGDGLDSTEMQLIAREMNLAETAFLSKSEKADFNLRWFTPAMEVELCGHATIASLHFLSEKKLISEGSEIKFDTLSGILKCRAENGKYFMQIPVYSGNEYKGNKNEIMDALGLTSEDIDEKIPFILLQNDYLYIYIKSLATLKELKPNFKELLKISKANNFGAAAVFTRETFEKDSFAHLRFFAPYYGIDEDPVTGSANGPLLIVLKKLGFVKDTEEDISLTFEQGDIIGRRGRINVKYFASSGELYISGNAVSVLKGEIFF